MGKNYPKPRPFEDDFVINAADYVLRRGKLSGNNPDIHRNPANAKLTFDIRNFSLSASENRNGYSVNSVQELRNNKVYITDFLKQPFSRLAVSKNQYRFAVGKSKVRLLKKLKMNFQYSPAEDDPNVERGKTHFVMGTNPYPIKDIEIASEKIVQREHILLCISKFSIFYPYDFTGSYRIKITARMREWFLSISYRIKYLFRKIK